jgi:hypothetical protein
LRKWVIDSEHKVLAMKAEPTFVPLAIKADPVSVDTLSLRARFAVVSWLALRSGC